MYFVLTVNMCIYVCLVASVLSTLLTVMTSAMFQSVIIYLFTHSHVKDELVH